MEKMIGVINDNLRNVINGIKTHRIDEEKNLATINAEIDEKVDIASQYKANVENARAVIASLENEISELERDLKDLNEKFGAKDFKEILAAGNKEISTKIIEKRSYISDQNRIIVEMTEKAHALKEQLLKLRESKRNTETLVNKSIILENYYEARILEIINYSEENSNSLEDYVLSNGIININELEVSDIDIDQVVDGSVFEEIDEISASSTMDEEAIKKAIDVINDESNGDNKYIDLSVTQKLDDIILAANAILEQEKHGEVVDEEISEEDETDETDVLTFVEPSEESDEQVLSDNLVIPEHEVFEDEERKDEEFNLIFDPEEEAAAAEAFNVLFEDEEVEVVPSLDVEVEENPDEESAMYDEKIEIELKPLEEVEEFEVYDSTKADKFSESIIEENDDFSLPTFEIVEDEEELTISDDELFETVEGLEDLGIIEGAPQENTDVLDIESIKQSLFKEEEPRNFRKELEECNLSYESFSKQDLTLLESFFNKNNTLDFVEVLKKHNIDIKEVYESVNILMNVTPQNLDKMISLLESIGATPETIGYEFHKLDKVNVNDLERAIRTNGNREVMEILYEAIPYNGENDLLDKLKLKQQEEMDFRNNTSIDEFKMMNLFPEIVLANYNELNKLGVNDINECLTKHPHKFTLNPDRFAEMLDKYDTDDLVRCINKNSAVLDKL